METARLGITDYVVVSLMLGFSAMIGIYFRLTGGKQRTMLEYFMADKSMSVMPVACSMMASFLSAVLFLGSPREAYVYGTQYVVYIIGHLVGNLIMTFLYLPVFFKLQNTSAYEYLEQRFGRVTRFLASASFLIQVELYTSIVLYAPSLALSTVTGFSKIASILSVGMVCTFYSTIGGMKAVLWTDVFQSLLILTAALTIMIQGVTDSNGIMEIWETAFAGGRLILFDLNPDLTIRYTFWTQFIGVTFFTLGAVSVTQIQIQRLLTIKDLRKSQVACFLTWVFYSSVLLVLIFNGLVIYSKYHDCDPVLSKRITTSDQLIPLFVMDYLSYFPGLAGLVVSGIFSASLSTISSSVNSLSAATLEDFIKPMLPKRWHRDHIFVWLIKALAFAYGILCVAFAFLVDQFGGLIQATFIILGIVSGPSLGLFSLGMFCPRSTQRGAITGFVISIVFTTWMGFGAIMAKPYTTPLPTSTEGCPAFSNVSFVETMSMSFINDSNKLVGTSVTNNTFTFTEEPVTDPLKFNESIFYLYRISPMWYSPISFVITMLVGMIVSFTENKLDVNPDLLSPICKYWHPTSYSLKSERENAVVNDCATKRNGQKKYSLVCVDTPGINAVKNFDSRL